STALAADHWYYAAFAAGQAVFYGFAVAGAASEHARERLARLAYAFVMLNYAAVAGLAALRRRREVWR
ncbi:MAG: hypothetical protein ACRD1V_21025, partial [Vicinamibacterales bacterium]